MVAFSTSCRYPSRTAARSRSLVPYRLIRMGRGHSTSEYDYQKCTICGIPTSNRLHFLFLFFVFGNYSFSSGSDHRGILTKILRPIPNSNGSQRFDQELESTTLNQSTTPHYYSDPPAYDQPITGNTYSIIPQPVLLRGKREAGNVKVERGKRKNKYLAPLESIVRRSRRNSATTGSAHPTKSQACSPFSCRFYTFSKPTISEVTGVLSALMYTLLFLQRVQAYIELHEGGWESAPGIST